MSLVIDADGHLLEPPDVWEEHLEAKYKSRAIRIRTNPHGLEYLELDGRPARRLPPGVLSSLGGMGRAPAALRPDEQLTYVSCAPFGSMNADQRVELLARERVDKALLYPTIGIMWEAEIDDAELAQAYCSAYNRWIAAFCRPHRDRLIPIAHLSLGDPDAAARELERAVRDGCRGAFVATFTHTRKPHGHPDHDPVFAMAQKLGVPLGIHPATQPETLVNPRLQGTPTPLAHVLAAQIQQHAVATLFQFGTFERFPELRIVILESGSSWLGYWLDRMDAAFRSELGGSLGSRKPPSEYARTQLWISGDPDERASAYLIEAVGPDRLFWASDYPHPDHGGDYIAELAQMVAPMAEETRRGVLGDNVARCYRL